MLTSRTAVLCASILTLSNVFAQGTESPASTVAPKYSNEFLAI